MFGICAVLQDGVYTGRDGAGVSLVVDMSIDGKDECREEGCWGGEAFRNL
ncbi:hypothetical protein NAI64_05265 [Oxalobacter sp. OxGP1]|mgnify:FL=1|nr:hypothetical protein [Oxalobacter paeniformigenes]MCZ4053132.1 hypothetical protein [Oxalobacter paeniformigenes]